MRTLLSLGLLLGGLPIALAQDELAGPGQYPQFRTLGGLPGNGAPLTRNGQPRRPGALSFSTPVAYGLAPFRVVAATSLVNSTRSLRFDFERGGNVAGGNWTASLAFGLPIGSNGQLTFSNMLLSSYLDNAQNAQWTPAQSGPITFAIGVQDIGGQGGSQGMDNNRNDPGESRSWYVVATQSPRENVHLSLGLGDTRFRGRPFGSASAWFNQTGATLEWDTYNWNVLISQSLTIAGRESTLSLGLVRGKYALWSIGIAF